MTTNFKQELISKIVTLLNELIIITENAENVISPKDEKLEMLTIKECTELVKGLSEHTVRQFVKQNKIPYIQTGQGKCVLSKMENEPLKYKAFFYLMAYSGLRRGEMLGLEWKDIDFINNIICVKRTDCSLNGMANRNIQTQPTNG